MTTVRHKPFVVGITGGIGSGKSAATALFSAHGITVVDADVIAREVVAVGQPALAEIASHFGKHILTADGSLNRAALREIIFSDATARHWLESLLHPLIRERIHRALAEARTPYCILSSPLLFESGQAAMADTVVLIDASEPLQIARTRERDGVSAEAVKAIMRSQWPREKKQEQADTIVLNEGTLTDLASAVDTLHRQFLQQAAQKQRLPKESSPQ